MLVQRLKLFRNGLAIVVLLAVPAISDESCIRCTSRLQSLQGFLQANGHRIETPRPDRRGIRVLYGRAEEGALREDRFGRPIRVALLAAGRETPILHFLLYSRSGDQEL